MCYMCVLIMPGKVHDHHPLHVSLHLDGSEGRIVRFCAHAFIRTLILGRVDRRQTCVADARAVETADATA